MMKDPAWETRLQKAGALNKVTTDFNGKVLRINPVKPKAQKTMQP